jgi:hypothetical protein
MGFGFRIPKKQNAEEIDVGHRCDDERPWICWHRHMKLSRKKSDTDETWNIRRITKQLFFQALSLYYLISIRRIIRPWVDFCINACIIKWFVSVNKLFLIELFVGRRLRADPSTGRLIGVKLSHRSAWMATESITFQTPLLAADVGPTDYLAACWVPSSSCDTCRK